MSPFGKIRNRLHLTGRDSAILLMSLLVAFVIWLASNLSQSYSGVVSVPIIAESNIDGHSRESSTSSTVTARCHMSGYNLLRKPYFFSFVFLIEQCDIVPGLISVSTITNAIFTQILCSPVQENIYRFYAKTNQSPLPDSLLYAF